MAVNIDPSEVRAGTSSGQAAAKPRLRLPLRTMLIGGLGGAGLIAFSVGAFSFFSTLADPRARTPRPMPTAASMPDLKDGMPALVNGDPTGSPSKAATLNLPRPKADEPVAPLPLPTEQASAELPVVKPAPLAASSDPLPPALRTGTTPPPIQNAATLPEMRTVAIVAPPARTVAMIAPARAETIKAKAVPASAVASAAPSRDAEPLAEPTSTATAVATSPVQPTRKPVAAKPPVQKTASRKAPSTKTVAKAEPDAAPAPVATSAGSDDSELPGARQFRAGVKAITGIFDGGSKDE